MSEHLQEGNIVRIICNSNKRALRILNGNVDGNGSLGEYARFIVHVRSSGAIVLQNYKEPGNHLAIYQGRLIGTGQGGPFCEFRVCASNLGNGMISLESVQCPSQFVGIMPNGSTKLPNNTKKGPHGSFSVELVQSAAPVPSPYGHPPPQPQYTPQPAYPPQQAYPPPQQAYQPPQQTYPPPPQQGYQPQPPPYQPPQQPAYQPPQQPAYQPPQQPAYQPPQQPAYQPPQKPAYPPSQPGYQPPPQQSYGGYTTPTYPTQPAPSSSSMALFKHGYMIRLRCASTGRYLRIMPNESTINGEGGEGELTKFIVVTRGPGVVSLQWAQNPRHYIGVYNNILKVGPGHLYCAFRIHNSDHNPNDVSFECVDAPGRSYLGILPSGEPKTPSGTARGLHGTFTPVFIQEVNMHANIGLRSNAYWRLAHGNVVHLTARVNGKNLRMHANGAFDCKGGRDNQSKWIVENRGNGAVTLRSYNDQKKYINMEQSKLGIGTGGDLCVFNVEDPNDNMTEYICFSLMSNRHLHLGVEKSGLIRAPIQTGNGVHGQFLVTVADHINY